ncbi:MAG: ATP-binding protein [Lachnospiraceae bacterium]|nr:ATP-binding protein [Lachnospiraceae bacterium]
MEKRKERFISPLDTKDVNKTSTDTSLYTVEYPKTSLDSLVVPEKTDKQIRSILTKIKNYDILYNKFGLREIDKTGGRTLINFYGPPGTGKSFAAEAMAKELGKKIIKVNYAQIESKFVGETPKNIKEIFKAAKREDAVVLFDEADSILGSRLSNVTQSTDHAVNVSKSVMLLEMDNFDGVMIFTTNFGKNYDSAFVRRIIGHIEFELPNKENRKKIFLGLLPSRLPVSTTDDDIEEIVRISEGLSGGDLLNMVLYASSLAVERDGERCRVSFDDFKEACALIKKAKSEIGKTK